MSRAGAGEPIQVRPQSNIYTALAAAAVAVQVFGLIVILIRANSTVGSLF